MGGKLRRAAKTGWGDLQPQLQNDFQMTVKHPKGVMLKFNYKKQVSSKSIPDCYGTEVESVNVLSTFGLHSPRPPPTL